MIGMICLVFASFLVLGLPIYASFLIACAAALVFFMGGVNMLLVANQTMFASMIKFSLLAVPFFIYAAEVMGKGGLAKRLVDFVMSLASWIRGSLSVTMAVTAGFMGAISGSGPATVAALGKILYRRLTDEGYSEEVASGLLVSTSAMSVVIPPSITMIVIGSLANVSVGSLFIGGIVPGVLFIGLYSGYGMWYAKKHNLPYEPRIDWGKAWRATKEAVWALGTPVIILGGIYSGIFTPTEASVVVSVYVTLISTMIYKEMTWKDIWNTAISSAVTTAQIFVVLAASAVLSWILTISGVANRITTLITVVQPPDWVLLLIINIILLIAGMFIDSISALTIMVPLLMPIVSLTSIDPLHLCLVIVINLALGLFSPPFGLNLFVAQGALRIPITKLYKGVMPYFAMSILLLLLFTYVPVLTVGLPALLYSR